MQEGFRIFPWIIVENMVKYLYFKMRRKSTMKRILLSLLAVVFCLSLAACGSGGHRSGHRQRHYSVKP